MDDTYIDDHALIISLQYEIKQLKEKVDKMETAFRWMNHTVS